MNRRHVLKTLAALPVAGLLGCKPEKVEGQPPEGTNFKVRTVQILLEGAFSLVLFKNKPNRLTAFVPKPEPGHDDLIHDFFFNDPTTARPAIERGSAGYEFELSPHGLKSYADTYINPGFNDFLAETEKWRLPNRLVTINLPFPNSINFGGKPLRVTFKSGRSGMMPTNFILEYYARDAKELKLNCPNLGGQCEPSPHCPPGIARFFFGVAPRTKEPAKQRQHAIDFFNFTLRTSFPDLVEKFSLRDIELSEEEESRQQATERQMSGLQGSSTFLAPAVWNSRGRGVHLLGVSETVDCQVGGVIVKTSSPAAP